MFSKIKIRKTKEGGTEVEMWSIDYGLELTF